MGNKLIGNLKAQASREADELGWWIQIPEASQTFMLWCQGGIVHAFAVLCYVWQPVVFLGVDSIVGRLEVIWEWGHSPRKRITPTVITGTTPTIAVLEACLLETKVQDTPYCLGPLQMLYLLKASWKEKLFHFCFNLWSYAHMVFTMIMHTVPAGNSDTVIQCYIHVNSVQNIDNTFL